jgi:hypothetical protein
MRPSLRLHILPLIGSKQLVRVRRGDLQIHIRRPSAHEGTERLRDGIVADENASGAGHAEMRVSKPSVVPPPDQAPRSRALSASSPRSNGSERQFASLLCPVCGEAMILAVPEQIGGRLLCPLCAREQFANTGLLAGIVASKMRRALKGTESTLGGDARLVLDEGFEQLRLVEHALGRLGAESDP